MGAIQGAVNSAISSVGSIVGNVTPKKPNKEPFSTHSDAKKKIATDNANKNKTARKAQQANFKNKLSQLQLPKPLIKAAKQTGYIEGGKS